MMCKEVFSTIIRNYTHDINNQLLTLNLIIEDLELDDSSFHFFNQTIQLLTLKASFYSLSADFIENDTKLTKLVEQIEAYQIYYKQKELDLVINNLDLFTPVQLQMITCFMECLSPLLIRRSQLIFKTNHHLQLKIVNEDYSFISRLHEKLNEQLFQHNEQMNNHCSIMIIKALCESHKLSLNLEKKERTITIVLLDNEKRDKGVVKTLEGSQLI